MAAFVAGLVAGPREDYADFSAAAGVTRHCHANAHAASSLCACGMGGSSVAHGFATRAVRKFLLILLETSRWKLLIEVGLSLCGCGWGPVWGVFGCGGVAAARDLKSNRKNISQLLLKLRRPILCRNALSGHC